MKYSAFFQNIGTQYITLLALLVASSVTHGSPIWQDVDPQNIRAGTFAKSQVRVTASDFRLVQLNPKALTAAIEPIQQGELAFLELPKPDGGTEVFEVYEVPTMAPELQQWMGLQGYDMRTYAGVSLDNPETTLRMDWGGPLGWHVSVVRQSEGYYLDPYWADNKIYYASYARASKSITQDGHWRCGVDEYAENHPQRQLNTGAKNQSRVAARTSGVLRTYRLANAATAEYTSAVGGGTQAGGQAAIVTAINRVNQVYERDLSIRLVLVANNQSVVYTNFLLDPYTNDNGVLMLDENQNNLDSEIGSANYDIGHVFSTGGGGVAVLQSPCNAAHKAKGVTGLPNPTGDAFFIDFVAHEIGHQFGGNHTWHSSDTNCGVGQRNNSTALEPGSGTTIMAYAGVCNSDNVQNNSDAYFHFASINEILDYTQAGAGGSCNATTSTGNANAPTVDAGANVTIPANTPFELTALNGLDAQPGSTLTYLWEQFDLGPATTLAQGDTGSGPIIRSSSPTTSPTRSIPPLADVLDGSNSSSRSAEILPTTNRSMTWRVTVFDNDTNGGRVGTDTRTVNVTTNGSGQFAVTSPNGGESLGTTATVTWNIASTSSAPVNANNVDIFYSSDGGASFNPLLLATPNDGSQVVTFPAGDTTQGRIKIRGSNNIFYDISDGDFTVNSVSPATVTIGDASTQEGDAGTTNLAFTVTLSSAQAGATTVTFNTADGSATTANNDYVGVTGGNVVIPAGSTSGTITITVNGDSNVESNETMTVTLTSANNGVAVGSPSSGTGIIVNDDSSGSSGGGSSSSSDGNGGGGGGGSVNWLLLILMMTVAFRRRISQPNRS